jgi:photosystem II stability/assembly factor-like uncharacterized protein
MPIASGPGGALWQLLGPAPLVSGTTRLGGRTPSIALDPSNPDTLYIGAALGGVWRSTDSGASWTPLTDDQPSLAMGSIMVDPTDSNVLYAGTGEQDFSGDSYYGAGVLRSMDAGATWTRLGENELVLPTGGGATISRVVVDPISPNIVYVASNYGLFKSTDRGDTWALKLSGRSPLAAVTELVMDPSDSSILYAGVAVPSTATNRGIYKSTDSGETWVQLDVRLPPANVGRINIGISRSNPLILYAAINNAATAGQIQRLKTTDGGATWVQLPLCTGSGCGQGSYNLAVAVDPNNPDVVYQAAVSMYRSLDGGSTWNTRSGGHVDYHSLVFDDSSNLYITSDGGIFRLSAGDVLSSLNNGIAITQLYPGLALHPTNPAIVQAGAQDNGSDRTTGDLQWRIVCGGDGAFQAIEGPDGNPDMVWYCSSQRLGIRKTFNNGQSTVPATTGITDQSAAAFIAPYIIDPNNSQVLLASTREVWRTENGATRWVANSPALTTGSIRSLAFDPNASSTTYYAGTSLGEIWRTSNTGVDWVLINSGLPQSRVVTHIAVHPLDSSIVYATFSGFGTGHIFRSNDQGDTWLDISGNLPNLPTPALLVDATSATPALYVGTDLGVFRSLDDGGSWERFSSGLPNVRVEDLVLNPTTGVLAASTHGRGVWQLVVAEGGR